MKIGTVKGVLDRENQKSNNTYFSDSCLIADRVQQAGRHHRYGT